MAKDTTKEIVKKEAEKINKSAEINEAYFVGLLWSDPYDTYSIYSDTISLDEFVHPIWGFYFELGRKMYGEGIKTFDAITVHTKVKEYNVMDSFEEYGKLRQIEDAVDIVKHNADNVEYYYETIKRNYAIRQLHALFGDKVLINNGKYKWQEMTREQITTYWVDKMNKIGLSNVNKYEAENMYIEADEFIKKLKEDSAEMLPFYNSYLMNSVTQGGARGHVTMIGGFGNTGKSSMSTEKVVMSWIANKEKGLLILNEEDAQAIRQKIVLSILFHEYKTGFDRKKLVNGKLGQKEEQLIHKAFEKMKELLEGEEALIKLIFMEKYVISDLEKIVKFWANRGYINLLIDTHKVSDDSKHDIRWETFVEDMKTIYRLTRKNAGGCNLRTTVTFQLADSAIKNRYLSFEAIGEGKASKNEASVLLMFRPCWSDEYEDGKKELDCYKLKKNSSGEYVKEYFKLKKGKIYYLLFTPKNRFGLNNDGGCPILVMEAQLNFNHFKEVGWTFVAKDHN